MNDWSGSNFFSTSCGAGTTHAGGAESADSKGKKSDRRATPRTAAEKLAYIHLEPDSGGIVLNVSDGGLCFYAVAPLRETEMVRFWFSMRAEQRIEGVGELAWSDKKTGGLRFLSIPEGAPDLIRRWISESSPALSAPAAQPVSLNRPVPVEGQDPAAKQGIARTQVVEIARQTNSKAGSATTAAKTVRSSQIRQREPGGPIHWVAPREARGRTDGYEGLRMIVAGVVISAIMVAASLLIYPKQNDPLLVEAMTNTSVNVPAEGQTADRSSATAPGTHSRPSAGASGSDAREELRTEMAKLAAAYDDDSEKPEGARSTGAMNAQRPDQKIEQSHAASSIEAPTMQGMALHPAISDSGTLWARQVAPFPPPIAGSVSRPVAAEPPSTKSGRATNSVAPNGLLPGNVLPSNRAINPREVSPQELHAGLPTEGEPSADERYFDVGDFKELDWAERATSELARSGFSSRIMHKRRLWMNSYHVLVGPYSSDNEAEIAREGLESHGYKPRFAR